MKYILPIFILILFILILFIIIYLKVISKKSSSIISLGLPSIPKHTKHLDELIDSVNNQELLPYEIIISLSETNANDGKQLEDKLNKLSKVNVKIIASEKKQYEGENRNICGKHCNTEIISFIDSDDLLCPSRIWVLEDVYKKYNYDVLYHNYNIRDDISQCSNNYKIVNDRNVTKKQYEDSAIIFSAGHLTIRTDLLNKYQMDISKGVGIDIRYLHTLFENNINIVSLPDYKGTVYRIENSSYHGKASL